MRVRRKSAGGTGSCCGTRAREPYRLGYGHASFLAPDALAGAPCGRATRHGDGMSLKEIPLPSEAALADVPVPPDAEALILDCEERYAAFQDRKVEEAVIAFVQSDLRTAHRALWWVRDRDLLPGRTMLEWGSGVGAVALLAARLGFDATGIEVDASLVDDAREIAARHDLPATFACGSFLPEEADMAPQDMEEFAWLDTSAPSAYDEVGLDIDDCDLVFAYPWPGEEGVLFELFDAYAGRGACLLTNHGLEGMRLHRKA